MVLSVLAVYGWSHETILILEFVFHFISLALAGQ